jgi:mannose-6-phosphate isomerase-like protein (cupin superfamily)
LPEGFLATAPDGMPVRVLPLAPGNYMGAAVGYLAPGASYAVHFHYALEQLSFVVRGQVEVTMQPPGAAEPTRQLVRAGDAITNPPGVTLSFANRGPEPAEVLFVCAPPYPADDADTQLVEAHRELTGEERARRGERAAWALDHFRVATDPRLP